MKKKILCMLLITLLTVLSVGCSAVREITRTDSSRDLSEVPFEKLQGEKELRPVPAEPVGSVTEPEVPTSEVIGPNEEGPVITDEPEYPVAGNTDTDIAPYWFEDDLRSFLEDESGWGEKSYMVSPASFRAALCLAIEGASGETHDVLLKAARFSNDTAVQNWYNELKTRQDDFMDLYENMKSWGMGEDPGMSFDLANGIWDNASKPGDFRQEYISAVESKYGATAASSDKDSITADVNSWCEEKTHGMIKQVSDDLSKVSSILANSLYIKSSWCDTFSEYNTAPGTFTMANGNTVDLDFMQQTEDFRYYKDFAGREYAMFGLEGDLWLTVCLDADARVQDLFGAMYASQYTNLDVRMPKLDMETSFNHSELTSFLDYQGAGLATSDFADFSKMTDFPEGWHIDDIIQKTRIKTDEDGLEAAAVTVIAMADNMALFEPVEPIPFYMDQPFSFLITAGRYSVDTDATVLFFGQFTGV